MEWWELASARQGGICRVRAGGVYGVHYNRSFVTQADRSEILAWISSIHPIWEQRYSANNPPPSGKPQRRLLRPVYWLGNWQFACLDYYRPPSGVHGRCVRAEPFPPVLARLVREIERTARAMLRPADVPKLWRLNTCLVNFYGERIEGDKRIDCARVGEHKDFEPGPVASVSLGERALFQFVSSRKIGTRDSVVLQQWLDDGSLQIFGGEKWKRQLFHRVQRVDKKLRHVFEINVRDFRTRRINCTFRYVPEEHITAFRDLPKTAADDVRSYMDELAQHSEFFRAQVHY